MANDGKGILDPDNWGDSWFARSDVPGRVATGVEGFAEGVLPSGALSLIDKKVHGDADSGRAARAERYSTTSGAANIGGRILRDTVAVALAGPAMLYGVAAADAAGEIAEAKVTNNPEFGGTFIAGAILKNAFGGVINRYAPEVINAAGKAVGSAAGTVGKAVLKSDIGQTAAQQMSKTKGVLDDFYKEAKDSGYLWRTLAGVRESASKTIGELDDSIRTYLTPADDVVKIGNDDFGVRDQLLGRIRWTAKQLTSTADEASRETLEKLAARVEEAGPLTARRAYEVEQDLRLLARGSKQAGGVAARAVSDTDSYLKAAYEDSRVFTDDLLSKANVAPGPFRDMTQKMSAQRALLEDLNRSGSTQSIGKQLAGAAVAGGAGYATSTAARALGADPKLAGTLGVLAGAATGHTAGVKYLDVAKGLVRTGARVTAGVGHAVGEGLESAASVMTRPSLTATEKQVMENYVSQKFAGKVWGAAREALNGRPLATGQPLDTLAEMGFEKAWTAVQHYHSSSAEFDRKLQEQLTNLPIPEAAQYDIFTRMKEDLGYLTKDLAPADPLAPAGTRAPTQRTKTKFRARLQALVDPESVLRNPRGEALNTLRERRPAVYSEYINAVLHHAGPNIGPSAPARQMLDRLGASDALKQAGRKAQALYAPQPMPAPTARQRSGGNGGSVNINVSTATDNLEHGSD